MEPEAFERLGKLIQERNRVAAQIAALINRPAYKPLFQARSVKIGSQNQHPKQELEGRRDPPCPMAANLEANAEQPNCALRA